MFAAGASGKPAAAGATTDPNFNSTTLLLETTGTNGQQNNTFLDSSTNNFTVTRTGTPTQGTFTPFSQTGWGGYFNGTPDGLSIANNTALLPLTGDFTLEMWMYQTITTFNRRPYGIGGYGAAGNFQLEMSAGPTNSYINVHINGAYTSYLNTKQYLNEWVHIAVVRISGVVTVYSNGTSIGSATQSGNANSTAAAEIASNSGAYYGGYISNLRFVKGTALYTSNFTPSTTPLTAVSGTALLTLQSNYFKDNSSNNFAITATGTPSIQAFSPFAPAAAYSTSAVGGSMYFSGLANNYLSVPYSAALDISTGDFTIECWMYTNTTGIWFSTYLTGGVGLAVTGGIYYLSSNGSSWNIAAGVSIGTWPLNQWVHFAFVRNGSVFTPYINGIAGTTTTSAATLSINTQGYGIGNNGQGYAAPAGNMSSFRIVKGTALYTANFTPPTAPLTAVTNTALLLNATNAGIYDATANNDVTTVGTAQASTTQSKFGGTSMYFNGTTDYLKLPSSQNFNFGTGSLTIECWLYLNAYTNSGSIFDFGNGVGTTRLELFQSNTLGNISAWSGGSNFITSSSTVPLSTWTHIAFVRNGSACTLYFNGVSVGTATNSNSWTDANCFIGTLNNNLTIFLNAYIDDLRITKGIARYTANFTPPTAPFPVS